MRKHLHESARETSLVIGDGDVCRELAGIGWWWVVVMSCCSQSATVAENLDVTICASVKHQVTLWHGKSVVFL